MIIRFESSANSIFYIDCTQAAGVACGNWNSLRKVIGPNKFYGKCIYRKVNFQRSDEVSENIETFLKEVDKLPWELSYQKLTRKESLPLKDGDRKFVDKDRTFHSSELIAKAFKAIGVFKDDGKSCT